MKVAFHLRRLSRRLEPPTAILVETDRVETLLDLDQPGWFCHANLSDFHRVSGGFLVKLGEGLEALPPSGSIRLRRLAA